MAAHTALGYLLAVGLAGAAAGVRLGPALLGLVLWVVCLNGGTLALNSAFDRDEGDVAYLRRPPAPPRHLAAFSLALMVAGQILAFLPAAPLPDGVRRVLRAVGARTRCRRSGSRRWPAPTGSSTCGASAR